MAGATLTRRLVEDHLVEGRAEPGEEVALRVDQTLTQDATGTLVMLELEALGLERVETEVSVQYVDHNLLQEDHKNPDDHLFLESACRRFGVRYSRAGNGVSHPVHQERFGRPGATLLGSDSHTCAAGALGMLAIGAGGLEVALAMAGEPYRVRMPRVVGVRLEGALPDWVGAKDVALEMLRRRGVDGGAGRVFEYSGPGLDGLSAMDRHVIANLGAELGATTTVFPSDRETRRFLRAHGREDDWRELEAEPGAVHDERETIDLAALEPLIALPSSPGNVVPVREVAGRPCAQAYLGSSANPGYRDFAVAAEMVKGRTVRDDVSFDVNPTSRRVLLTLVRDGHLGSLLAAGARLHQTGCNGCIGMGQAPATGRNSLRTVPRNFPGRSGTREDAVHLCSPETATASALRGVITDPRDLDASYPRVADPDEPVRDDELISEPPEDGRDVELVKGPNVRSLPRLPPFPDDLEAEVLLVAGDDVSTDEILPAGARVLPYRSNIDRIADFCFEAIDEAYPWRARERGGDHAVVGGRNYGQGSSREHAALAPRALGLRLVVADSIARIHRRNLVNFGVLPATFADPEDRERLGRGAVVRLRDAVGRLERGEELALEVDGERIPLAVDLSPREVEVLCAGGLLSHVRARRADSGGGRRANR